MNVPLITMPAEEAVIKSDAYHFENVHRNDPEYQAAEAGFEALAQGKPLLNLVAAFEHAGLGPDNRPRLAIARADRRQVQVSRDFWNNPKAWIFNTKLSPMGPEGGPSLRVVVPWHDNVPPVTGFSLVPLVPADVRQEVKFNPRECFILWEVESWSDRLIGAQPPRDPYLLKHLTGALYAVLAEWELTELERAIMAERRNA